MPAQPAYDLLSLGEVLLRLDPGEGRVRTSRQFTAWEGGGEYNVARGARRCFGLRSGILTAFADNEIGRLIEDLILQGGVDTSLVKWVPYDGMGKRVRNPINFTERGFGVRGAKGSVDRGNSAASQIKPGDFDFDHLFGRLGCKWLHTGGIFAGLSESTAEVTIQACEEAKKHGVTVSYDLNYRPSLWQERGGFPAAQALNRRLAPYVNVMIGVLSDDPPSASAVPSDPSDIFAAEDAKLRPMMEKLAGEYPNLHTIAATLRRVHTASINDWGALCWHRGQFHRSRNYPRFDILDRIGAGDSFVAGLIHGLLVENDAQRAVDYGAAHGALAMTTPGDTSMATFVEVQKLAEGGDAKVQR
ncbi:MAG: sugar kinase [Prosthecobacter sp.]|jgi:2-dehydro-3-deoxygluconokinase|uniref:sugar kinase n=1 Tax=Prosthecobacter sp. TaxID=1965333 RepID=UPI0019EF07B3|nr:sugar kinase [Prosthecobacter sp.]MBE2285567.1 sugar kinase [Prosthecobacter sp.]